MVPVLQAVLALPRPQVQQSGVRQRPARHRQLRRGQHPLAVRLGRLVVLRPAREPQLRHAADEHRVRPGAVAGAAPGDAATRDGRPGAVCHQAARGRHAQCYPRPHHRRWWRRHRQRRRPPGGACARQRGHAERLAGQRRREQDRFTRQHLGHALPQPARPGPWPGQRQRQRVQRRAVAELRELRPAARRRQRPVHAGRAADRRPGRDHPGVAGCRQRPDHHQQHPGRHQHPGRRRQRHRHRQRRPERAGGHPGQAAGRRQRRDLRAVHRHHLQRTVPQPHPGRGADAGDQQCRRHRGQPEGARERQDPVGQPHRAHLGAGHGDQCVEQQQHPPPGHAARHLLDPDQREPAGPGAG